MLAHSRAKFSPSEPRNGRKEEKKRGKKKNKNNEKRKDLTTTVQRNNRNLSEELVSVGVSFKRAKS